MKRVGRRNAQRQKDQHTGWSRKGSGAILRDGLCNRRAGASGQRTRESQFTEAEQRIQNKFSVGAGKLYLNVRNGSGGRCNQGGPHHLARKNPRNKKQTNVIGEEDRKEINMAWRYWWTTQ